jgi:hypothetical protein
VAQITMQLGLLDVKASDVIDSEELEQESKGWRPSHYKII